MVWYDDGDMSIYEINCPECLLPVESWCQSQPINLCVVFGSRATGKIHAHSDVDLAVWPIGTMAAAVKLRWVTELERLLEKDVSMRALSLRSKISAS